MGWLDKGFKNIVKGGKDILSSPAGIMLLSAAAPWLAPKMAPMMTKLAGNKFGSMLTSPWVKNALTNAAMQGGIATITGSKHPWKAMGYSALASLPFTALQSAQAATAYNKIPGIKDKKKWWDFAKGDIGVEDIVTIPGESTAGYSFDKEMIPQYGEADVMTGYLPGDSIGPPKISTSFGPSQTVDLADKGIDMSYFLNPEQADKFSDNKGLAGLFSALSGPVDMPAAIVPQITGMYGGRMTEEEKWLAGKEKQIRLWAFQHGIPYEEAKEIWKDGYRNPYYETRTPKDYNFQFNKGGSVPYKDDYTAGGSAVGPGTGTSDSIRPVALSDGEFVFTEEATNNFPGGHEGLYSLMNSLDPNSERPEEARV
jgi:hypothetical protein